MQIKSYFLLAAILLLATKFYSQVGIGTTTPAAPAMLEISSTSDAGATYRGLMPPRVLNIAVRDEINVAPSDVGLLIFVESTKCLQIWTGTDWLNVACTQIWPVIQNFDTTPAASELPLFSVTGGYYTTGSNTDGFPSGPLYANGDRGYGVNNTSGTVQLGPIDVSGATTATFRLRLAGFSKSEGNGMDSTDTVIISVSTTGTSGTFTKQLRIEGGDDLNSNNQWGFTAVRAVTTAWDTDDTPTSFTSGAGDHPTTGGISFLEITGIPNSPTLAIKIEMLNDKENEIWVIDDAEIWGN